MTSVVKIGGSSLATLDSTLQIMKQLRDLDEDLVITVSAQGKTTDRIAHAIESARNGRRIEPEEVFTEFEAMYTGLPKGNYLRGLRDSVFGEFGKILAKGREELDSPSQTAYLHLCGERLSAALFASIMSGNGNNSEFIDFFSHTFPLVVKGDYHNARIDFDETRKRAYLQEINRRSIILPGYGGIDKEGRAKTLGRGGSDTTAFGYLYAFQGNSLWMLTDVDGILENANIDGSRTVESIDLAEAKDGATLGAKLPGRRALEGAEKYFKEGARPEIFVAHSQDMDGPKTRIVYKTEEKMPVKFVAGRDIVLYELEGNLRGLHNKLEESGIEFAGFISNDYARIVIPDDAKDYAARIMGELFENGNGSRGDVEIQRYADFSLIGAVGNGMYQNGNENSNESSVGITAAAGSTLSTSGVDIKYNMDPGKVSLGFIVRRGDMAPAINALYRRFLSNGY